MPSYDEHVLNDVLARLAAAPIAPTEKGFAALGPVSPAELAASTADLTDLTLPAMVLRNAALRSNVATMAAWCAGHGVQHAPHGKTPMSPQILARQFHAGVWGVTAATIGQVRVFVEFGARRIILANQLVDGPGIGWLTRALTELPELEVIGYVDTVAGVQLLDSALAAAGTPRPLPVLVEVGLPGKRTGARSIEEALTVANAAKLARGLSVVGASAFEGVLGPGRSQETLEAVAALCADVRAVGLAAADDRVVDRPILSGGGSTYFDVVARELSGAEPADVVIRSGGYVTHDDGMYATATPLPSDEPDGLHAAIDVWAHVLSRPEPTRALAGAGKRDLPFDAALPVVRNVPDAEVVMLNDQHAFIDVPAGSELAPGDRVCFGIAHPCTAFDKWRVIPIVDEAGRIEEIAHTFF